MERGAGGHGCAGDEGSGPWAQQGVVLGTLHPCPPASHPSPVRWARVGPEAPAPPPAGLLAFISAPPVQQGQPKPGSLHPLGIGLGPRTRVPASAVPLPHFLLPLLSPPPPWSSIPLRFYLCFVSFPPLLISPLLFLLALYKQFTSLLFLCTRIELRTSCLPVRCCTILNCRFF